MVLTPISSVDRSAFRWLRDSDHPTAFTLLSGESTVATLAWHRKEGSLATAKGSQEEWTLKRGGFLNPHISVRSGGADIARLSVHLNYHQVHVAGGRSYRFHRAGILLPAWQVSGPNGKEILHVEPVREGRHLRGGAVVVAPEAMENPDLLLLVVLSWYFIVLAWFEDEAVEALAPLEGPDSPATYSS
jgi:hypothetical protein